MLSFRVTLIQSKNKKKEFVTSSCSYDVNKPLALPSTVTTPSRIVNGILNKKESPSVSPTSDAQIVPTTPVKVESNDAKVQEVCLFSDYVFVFNKPLYLYEETAASIEMLC